MTSSHDKARQAIEGFTQTPLKGLPALLEATRGKAIADVQQFKTDDHPFGLFKEDVTLVWFTDGTGLLVSLEGFFGGTEITPAEAGWVEYTKLTREGA